MRVTILALALVALVAGCDGSRSKTAAPSDPLSAARAAIISRNFADAADYARQAVDDKPDSPDGYFELARAEALRGNGGSAEGALGKALDKGLGDAGQKLQDPAFDSIRNDEAFARLSERASPGAAQSARKEREEPSVEISGDEVRAGDVSVNTDF